MVSIFNKYTLLVMISLVKHFGTNLCNTYIYYVQSTPVISKSKGPYYSFDMTEFRYKGSNINVLKALGENIHFGISCHFVITEFDITGVDCSILKKY